MQHIQKIILNFIFKTLSYLPLTWLQYLGGCVGILAMKLSKRAGNRIKTNLLATGMCNESDVDSMARDVAAEFGKTLFESACIAWQHSKEKITKLVLEAKNFDLVMQAASSNRPVVFLTPHIGNFEIAVKHFVTTNTKKLTILYKPDKNKVFNQIMLEGRRESNLNPVPTNRHGVASLMKALKANESIGILPDSVASGGDGVWVDFFGKKVFATTLAAKMVNYPDAVVFVVASYRVKGGFIADYQPYTPKSTDIKEIVQDLYKKFEKMILLAPTQYYWSYDRFRVPKHSPEIK